MLLLFYKDCLKAKRKYPTVESCKYDFTSKEEWKDFESNPDSLHMLAVSGNITAQSPHVLMPELYASKKQTPIKTFNMSIKGMLHYL